MKNKIFYILLVFLTMVIPIAVLRNPVAGIACFTTLLALFGAGRAFHSLVFPSKHFEFNSFGLGFILLAAAAWATAFYNISALLFTIIYIASAGYAVYWLLNYFKRDNAAANINITAVIIYLLILIFNIYPTLLIQGYQHGNSFSWQNTDAAVYTSIANRVKLGIYPITIPGFGIEKLYYHFGGYAFAGFIAHIFNLTASDSLFGIIRPLAVFAVITSLISIAITTANRININYRIAGALIGFFFIGSLTSVFKYLPFNFPRTDHGMKHLRGFLIAHSSLWIFLTLVPVISFINYKAVHKIKFNVADFILFAFVVACTPALNFIAAAVCGCLMLFFMLFYNPLNANNDFIRKRNILALILPFIVFLCAISFYLHTSINNIGASAFFLPVFDLSTWANYLAIFFLLYIGLRLFGLNYLFSKTENHSGYIQMIVLIAALSYMVVLGFFVEPKGGRENDIKYGYVIIEGTFGIFSGLWLAERFKNLWQTKLASVNINLKRLFYPVIIIFSLILIIAASAYINTMAAKGFIAPFLRPLLIAMVVIGLLLLIMRFKKNIFISKQILSGVFLLLILLSVPGVLYEFNKYRSIKGDDEGISLDAADLDLINQLNRLNETHAPVLLSLNDEDDPGFASGYKFNAMINAPVLHEGSNYFDVKHNKKFEQMGLQLDSLYASKSTVPLRHLTEQYGIEFCVFNKRLVSSAVFDSSTDFKVRSRISDSVYIVEYIHSP